MNVELERTHLKHQLERWTNRINDLKDMEGYLILQKEFDEFDKARQTIKNLAVKIYERELHQMIG